MKSGEVAVENSVNAFRELQNDKAKDRAAAAQYHHYDHRHRHHHHHQQPPHRQSVSPHQYLAQYPPQHYPSVQQLQHQSQRAAIVPAPPPPYAQRVQPVVPVYHRYNNDSPQPLGSYVAQGAMTPAQHQRLELLHGSGLKRSMRYPSTIQKPQPPPAPMSAQLAAAVELQPAGNLVTSHTNLLRQRTTRPGVCAQYLAHGRCHYGPSCKYSHNPQVKDMPRSAPPVLMDEIRLQNTAATANQVEESRINHPDSHFPSLLGDVQKSAVEKPSERFSSDHSPENGLLSPPSKQLVFRDAVLNQQSKALHSQLPSSSTISASKERESSDQEEYPSVKQEECVVAKNNVCSNQDSPGFEASQLNRGHQRDTDTRVGVRPDDAKRWTHDLARSADNNAVEKGSHDRSKVKSIPPVERSLPRVVEPEPGRTGYAMYQVYSSNQCYASDDSSSYSSLSRDAHNFVYQIDSQLRSLVGHQQMAMAKLQEFARSLLPDSTIDIYGSNFTRLALPKSDVDCVISSLSAESERPADVLRKLADGLQQMPWAKKIELLDAAKIPVLKIVFCSLSKSRTEVMLDLTCAHSPGHSGLSARTLIYSHQVEMPALRPLVLILKSHIQRHGLNNAFTGGLSSYGLVLLVIRFLQACGDEHHITSSAADHRREVGRSRSSSENGVLCNTLGGEHRPPVYEFTRDGALTWRTGLGNMLLLFLETYVTFDYRRFGISTSDAGEYFPLPVDKISLEPGAVVSPYIVDPIKKTRSIGNCFRMHEIIQAWYTLYQLLTGGVPLEEAIKQPIQASATA